MKDRSTPMDRQAVDKLSLTDVHLMMKLEGGGHMSGPSEQAGMKVLQGSQVRSGPGCVTSGPVVTGPQAARAEKVTTPPEGSGERDSG